ncbi:Harbinger transposase-derived nuclease domain [Phytophthora cactorum]|nr:Harbinger transposase-derived nuclease domain [Phytophthora cactorum]
MDGILIAINRPRDFEGWYNRKGTYVADEILAVCDHLKRFLSFDVRPGSWSDAKIFQHSSFGRDIDHLLPRGHHVLVDSGYGVAPAAMTPYGDDGATLTKPLDERSPTASVRIVVGCLVLHHILIDLQDTASIPSALENLIGEAEDAGVSVNHSIARDRTLRTKLGKQKRDEIAKLLAA